jgi:uncharacterized oxidoreductase
MKLDDRVALVTGGGTGIGRALALELAEAGAAAVVVCGRRRAPLEEVAAAHAAVHAHVADLAAPGAADALIAAVVGAHGRLDLLVNNAGVQYPEEVGSEAFDPAHADETLTVNLAAPIHLVHAALPHLRARPNGAAIVNVTSALAVTPKRSSPVYCASKAGLRSFTRALRYGLQGSGVRVLEVLPPLVDTPMTAGRERQRALSPERVAKEVVAALRDERTEAYVGGAGPLAWAERLAPGFVGRVMRRR